MNPGVIALFVSALEPAAAFEDQESEVDEELEPSSNSLTLTANALDRHMAAIRGRRFNADKNASSGLAAQRGKYVDRLP